VLPPDGLDHLDRDELVVGALQVSVVAHEDLDAVTQTGLGNPGQSVIALLAGDRGGGHATAASPRGVDGEAAPARADLEHVVLGPDLEPLADPVELGHRGLLERHALVLEERAGIHHRRVEHAAEQVVADVVVKGDIATAALPGAAVERRANPLMGRPQRGRAGAHAIDEDRVARGETNHRHEVG
jgi:hypothetical protein